MQKAAVVALSHHERFGGSGYPHGLAGEYTPAEGRLAAVADVFDALTTDRVYRRALPVPTAIETMKRNRGSQFDPQVLDGFLEVLPELRSIKEQWC